MKNSRIHRILILLFTLLLYADTLTLDYALDDRMVIMESKPVLQGGWQGTKSIFTEDTFSGFFGSDSKLVAGGRYRPLSQFTFLLEVQLFGKEIKKQIGDVNDYSNLHHPKNEAYFANSHLPLVSHLFNLLYFALLCLLIYQVLQMLFANYSGTSWYQSLPFIATLLFVLHPIHTEAIANVKGRDEIFAMLGAMAALWCCLKYADQHRWWYLLLAFAAMLFAMFSKENAITFLAVAPLSIFFLPTTNKRNSDYVVTLLPLLLAAALFIWARSSVLGGFMPADQTQNVLNNPFVHTSKADEIATVLLTWGIYLRLLVFPHPLTHDYYPWKMQISSFANPVVWLIVAGCIALLFVAFRGLKKKKVLTYAILFFVITFSITSNLLFNLGAFMNERFVFIPSLGFALAVGYGFYLLSVHPIALVRKASICLLCVVAFCFGAKSITRNLVWKDDITLFTTDVKVSDNSIKCNISAGGSFFQLWKKSHREKDKQLAYKHLYKALELDKYALNGHLLLADLMFMDDHKTEAMQEYANVLAIDPEHVLAKKNMAALQQSMLADEFDHAIQLSNQGKKEEALAYINQKLQQYPDNTLALNAKGNILGKAFQRYDEAIEVFQRIVELDPGFASAWENMGIAYAMKGNLKRAETCLLKALELNPESENIRQNLKMLYTQMGQPDKVIP